jgi:hypothetical protein
MASNKNSVYVDWSGLHHKKNFRRVRNAWLIMRECSNSGDKHWNTVRKRLQAVGRRGIGIQGLAEITAQLEHSRRHCVRWTRIWVRIAAAIRTGHCTNTSDYYINMPAEKLVNYMQSARRTEKTQTPCQETRQKVTSLTKTHTWHRFV